jgi:hypothetical protein
MKGVLVLVAGPKGERVKDATVTIDDSPNVHFKTTNEEGEAYFVVSEIPQSHLWIVHPAYQDYAHHLDLPEGNTQVRVGVPADPDRNDIILPSLQLLEAALEPLHVEGLRFVTASGVPWKMASLTGFRDYERWLRGEDIIPLIEQTVNLGANCRRIFGMFDFGSPNQQRLYPGEWGAEYYDRLAEFFKIYEEYGLYIEWTVFADSQRACPGTAEQIKHWELVTSRLRPIPNVLLEFCNELDSHENRPNITAAKPIGICSSSGSNGAGNDPPGPYWDYSALHSERPMNLPKLLQSTTTVAFSIYGTGGRFQGTRVATVVNEPIGFADVASPGRRVSDPNIAYYLGLGCQWGAGGTAHSDCGVQSVLLSPIQEACVREFIRGIIAE